MSNILAVIRREYLQRVRSKWFIFSTIGAPLLMLALIVLPAYFTARSEKNDRKLAVVDRTGVLAGRLTPRLEEAGYQIHPVPWSDTIVPHLSQAATDGEYGGFLVLDDETLSSGKAQLYSTSRPSTIRRLTIRNAVVATALEVQLQGRDVDASRMLAGGSLEVNELTSAGAGLDEPEFVVGYLGAFFLYMVILVYAVSVMRATLEEKTSRIVEVIISSMKPWHLMMGKILGVGAVGMTQIAVWFVSGILIFSTGLPTLAAAKPELLDMAQIHALLPGAGVLVLFIGYFVFGYFMFSGLYAAVGAMCNTEEETQQAQMPVMMLLIVPIIFMMNVIQNPNTPLSTGLSLFPFFSPILMFPRAAGGAAPWWQIALSFVLMAATIVGVAWVAGRIYKVGMLMAGKRPTLPELWRWVKEA